MQQCFTNANTRLQCQGTADVNPQDPSDDSGMCLLLGYQSIFTQVGCVDKHLVFMGCLASLCHKEYHWSTPFWWEF